MLFLRDNLKVRDLVVPLVAVHMMNLIAPEGLGIEMPVAEVYLMIGDLPVDEVRVVELSALVAVIVDVPCSH